MAQSMYLRNLAENVVSCMYFRPARLMIRQTMFAFLGWLTILRERET